MHKLQNKKLLQKQADYLGNLKYLILLLPSLCLSQDSWNGKDKLQHFTGSAILSYGLSEVMTPQEAFLATTTIGLAKEIYDYKHPAKHTASYKDLVADIAGAYMGLYIKRYSFEYDKKTFTIRYTFNIN